MASSVSSEHAFSSAGITITKRQNRLKGDIVEALQFLKAFYRKQPTNTATVNDSSPFTQAEGILSDDGLEEDVDSVVFAATDDDNDIVLCSI